MKQSAWYLYMLRLSNGALYTGISTDVMRRLAQHQAGKGAKVLRGKGELALAFQCKVGERGLATSLEYRIKQLNKQQKEAIISSSPLQLEHLLALLSYT